MKRFKNFGKVNSPVIELQIESLPTTVTNNIIEPKNITILEPKRKIISFGYRCISGSFIIDLGIKTESYPFDWMFSTLDIIKHSIDTNFIEFLNVDNYVKSTSPNYCIIDNVKTLVSNEITYYNKYYERDIDAELKYHHDISCNHRNVVNDLEYYERCVERLYNFLSSNIDKSYIHFCPIMGINDLIKNKESIIDKFDNFSNFITTKTTNIFGLFFVLVMNDSQTKSIKIKETKNYDIYVINCNKSFIEGGIPFWGEYSKEYSEIVNIITNHLT